MSGMPRRIWVSLLAILALPMAVPARAADQADAPAERRFFLPVGHVTAIPYGITAIDLDGDGKATEKILRARFSDLKGPGFSETMVFTQGDRGLFRVSVYGTSEWPSKPAFPKLSGKEQVVPRFEDIAPHGACHGLEAWIARDPGHRDMAAHLVLAWYVPEAGVDARLVRFGLFQLRDRFLDSEADEERELGAAPLKVPGYPDPLASQR